MLVFVIRDHAEAVHRIQCAFGIEAPEPGAEKARFEEAEAASGGGESEWERHDGESEEDENGEGGTGAGGGGHHGNYSREPDNSIRGFWGLTSLI